MTDATPDVDVQNDPVNDEIALLQERFPEAIEIDDREGYQGIIVDGDNLYEVATVVRDELGYDLLASATAVDYLEEDFFEMVYHAYNTKKGGEALNFKARTPRDVASLPSLVGVWRSADFQEREAYDLMGVYFSGHPNLKRILLWEGFHGHPMRKDWREPFYEENQKPFGSRWPEGHVIRTEYNNPYGKNVQYPPGFSMEDYHAKGDEAVYAGLQADDSGSGVHVQQIKTDELIVNLPDGR